MGKKILVIEVLGGAIADIWTDGDIDEAFIFDEESNYWSKVGINRAIPDFALEAVCSEQARGKIKEVQQ